MWIFLSDSFLSIVAKDCRPSELLVRARRRRDIIRVFPTARVESTPKADYQFRAVIRRSVVEDAIADRVWKIGYPNFKDSVDDRALHDAYSKVWQTMREVSRRRSLAAGSRP